MNVDDYSLDAIDKFLLVAGQDGSMRFNTARTRRTALRRLAKHLSPADKADLRVLDREKLATLLRSREQISEGTIQTYLTRLDSAIEAYANSQSRELSGKPASSSNDAAKSASRWITLALPFRGGIVRISNLPPDLTQVEVDQLCTALRAYVESEEI